MEDRGWELPNSCTRAGSGRSAGPPDGEVSAAKMSFDGTIEVFSPLAHSNVNRGKRKGGRQVGCGNRHGLSGRFHICGNILEDGLVEWTASAGGQSAKQVWRGAVDVPMTECILDLT